MFGGRRRRIHGSIRTTECRPKAEHWKTLMDETREKVREMAFRHTRNGDPAGWFDSVYRDARGNTGQVPWADLEPNPKLLERLRHHPKLQGAGQAVTVGCGLGDDAEALAGAGYAVTAFDVSPTAIEWCKQRFPDTKVDYREADLFSLPENWPGRFDLVFESNTIQALLGEARELALNAIAGLVAPAGVVLVSCRVRNPGEKEDAFPLPLTREELDGFLRAGLIREQLEAWIDDENRSIERCFSWYSRPST